MKKLNLATISALAVFGLAACGGGADNSTNTTNANRSAMNSNSNVAVVVNNNSNAAMNSTTSNTAGGSVSSADTDFLNKATIGGMAEVQLGQLASTKAANAEVKAFGQKMVQDHTNANTELKSVAGKKSVTLPTDLDEKHKELMEKLSKLSGAEFDKEYVKAMVEDHEKDVADFQKQSESGADADVKAFAAKTLPTLKMHLEMIKTLQGKMK